MFGDALLLVCTKKPENGNLVRLGGVCRCRLAPDTLGLWVTPIGEGVPTSMKLLQMLDYEFVEAPAEMYEALGEE